MDLYLDTEFNGHGGQLISLAIASEASGKHFYEVAPHPNKWHPWVAEHVVPFLGKEPITGVMFRHKLRDEYLQHREGCTIYADWPADFGHLIDCMAADDYGASWMIECSMVLLRGTEPEPAMPHNALSDAIALRDWHIAQSSQR